MIHPEWLVVERGEAPVLASIPHAGTEIPEGIRRNMVSPALSLRDTDWWLEYLYDFLRDLGVTIVRTKVSRTVADMNRDPSGISLYPGRATTELCPTTTFDGVPLYKPGWEPSQDEIEQRCSTYFRPYHEALEGEVARLSALHKRVVIYDCHSIRSVIPRLFSGELPHISIGTNDGLSCSPALSALVAATFSSSRYTCVTDERFKGGWITRQYGKPEQGIHAIQLELACRTYMAETDKLEPAPYSEARAREIRTYLKLALVRIIDWGQS
ncbi:N-formylglutamate deformylase [Methylorubrum rhodesianum]|uniref:N-formylglutamate deformylase n=1 Tax=Methylorubrum rhodesianum TaxID=29427 RepID=A0ABU9ZI23_9HYPH|nr:N-formylglutamate deformylase [Methylorubrum rhodesianum]